jgi:hypothetical protein
VRAFPSRYGVERFKIHSRRNARERSPENSADARERLDYIIRWGQLHRHPKKNLGIYQVDDDAHKELQIWIGNHLYFGIDEFTIQVVPFIENDAEARSSNYDAMATYMRNMYLGTMYLSLSNLKLLRCIRTLNRAVIMHIVGTGFLPTINKWDNRYYTWPATSLNLFLLLQLCKALVHVFGSCTMEELHSLLPSH